MQSIGPLVEYAVFAVLLVLSIMAVAITFERLRFYRTLQATRYSSRARLEADLTRRLNIIGTIGANAPYIGLLGTVLGIMVTFQTLGSGSNMDVKSIMTGLSLAVVSQRLVQSNPRRTAGGFVWSLSTVACPRYPTWLGGKQRIEKLRLEIYSPITTT